MKLGFAFAALALAAAAPASAAFVTLTLTGITNDSWSSQSFDGIPTGATILGGTPFDIDGDIDGARYFTFAGGGTNPLTFTTAVYGVTNAYSLINSFWGTTDTGLHTVTFNATGGLSQAFTLNGDDHIRDYYQNTYTNSINGTTTVNVFNTGARRLDMQKYALNAAFATQTLTSIVLQDDGDDGYSRMTLTGLTLETANVIPGGVPEPAAWALMIGGFGLAGAAARRRRTARHAAVA